MIKDVVTNILKRVSGPRGKIPCSQLPLLLVSLTVYSDLSGIELAACRHYGNSGNSDFLLGSIAAFFCPLIFAMQTKCRWVDTEDAMQCSQRGDCIGLQPRNDLLSRVIAHQFHTHGTLFHDGECTPGTVSGVNAERRAAATKTCGPPDHFIVSR